MFSCIIVLSFQIIIKNKDTMDQFNVAGHYIATNRNCNLVLPKIKHYKIHAVKNGEKELRVSDIITKAVNRNSYEPAHIRPATTKSDGEVLKLPRTLQKILSSHSYPLSQGPVLLPIERRIDRAVKPLSEARCFMTRQLSVTPSLRIATSGFQSTWVLLRGDSRVNTRSEI